MVAGSESMATRRFIRSGTLPGGLSSPCSPSGYETYPHTTTGKIFVVLLMIVGIALFGWLTATLASWFIYEFRKDISWYWVSMLVSCGRALVQAFFAGGVG